MDVVRDVRGPGVTGHVFARVTNRRYPDVSSRDADVVSDSANRSMWRRGTNVAVRQLPAVGATILVGKSPAPRCFGGQLRAARVRLMPVAPYTGHRSRLTAHIPVAPERCDGLLLNFPSPPSSGLRPNRRDSTSSHFDRSSILALIAVVEKVTMKRDTVPAQVRRAVLVEAGPQVRNTHVSSNNHRNSSYRALGRITGQHV